MEIYHNMIYTNLSLITRIFSNLDMEPKLQKGMFKKPNTKGMQSVFYSVMFVMNPDHCKKHVPWPISFASDTYKFRTSVIEFIKKECPDFEIPKLLPSLLNKADGTKYVKFVFDFVTYATKKIVLFKYGELLIDAPNTNICLEENLALLEDVTIATFEESKQCQNEHLKFMENSYSLAKLTQNTLTIKLKEFRAQKQSLSAELTSIYGTEVTLTDTTVKERLFSELEDEMLKKKNHHDKLRTQIQRILEKQKYLERLISIKKMMCTDIVNDTKFSNLINENFSKSVKIPLDKIKTDLFSNEIPPSNVNKFSLNKFLLYGTLAIDTHMKRLTDLNPMHKHSNIYQIVEDVSSNSTKRLNNLRQMSSDLENIIQICRLKFDKIEEKMLLGDSETWNEKYFAESECLAKLCDSYKPRRLIPIESCPILPSSNASYEVDDDSILIRKVKLKLQAFK